MGEKRQIEALLLCMVFFLASVLGISAPVGIAMETEPGGKYRGIDVSQWQGKIDFRKVKRDGIRVVYMKSSEGDDFKDPYFERNYRKARHAGLNIGFYHFVTARSEEQARRQAYYFATVIKGKHCECKPAMDFEDLTGLSKREVNEIAKAFLRAVAEYTKMEPVIYSDSNNASRIFSRSLGRYPLWIAQYGVRSPSDNNTWSRWAGWQYSDAGRISGIRGRVDLDFFTTEMFLEKSQVVSVSGKRPIPKERETVVSYKVRRGDTLTYIASLYHTTVRRIKRENHLNGERIYAGEILRIRIDNYAKDKEAFRYVTIRPGDTLCALARKYNTTVERLIRLNRIKNPNWIYPGQVLKIARVQTKVRR